MFGGFVGLILGFRVLGFVLCNGVVVEWVEVFDVVVLVEIVLGFFYKNIRRLNIIKIFSVYSVLFFSIIVIIIIKMVLKFRKE